MLNICEMDSHLQRVLLRCTNYRWGWKQRCHLHLAPSLIIQLRTLAVYTSCIKREPKQHTISQLRKEVARETTDEVVTKGWPASLCLLLDSQPPWSGIKWEQLEISCNHSSERISWTIAEVATKVDGNLRLVPLLLSDSQAPRSDSVVTELSVRGDIGVTAL